MLAVTHWSEGPGTDPQISNKPAQVEKEPPQSATAEQSGRVFVLRSDDAAVRARRVENALEAALSEMERSLAVKRRVRAATRKLDACLSAVDTAP